jgi:hypothetical protein
MDLDLPLFNPYQGLLSAIVRLILLSGLAGFLAGAMSALAARALRRGLPPLFRPLRHIFLILHGANVLLHLLILALPSQGPDNVAAVLLGINAAGAALWFWGARRIREEEVPDLKALLLAMPDAGEDEDLERLRDLPPDRDWS